MKTVVSVNEISEFEIKPQAELAQWKTLVAEEMNSRWADHKKWIDVTCPVCSGAAVQSAFTKAAFNYVECNHCGTLYAGSRPSADELFWWYTASRSTEFWKKQLLLSSAASRDEKIIEPRANWIMDGLSEYISPKALSSLHYTDVSFFGKALVEKIVQYAPGMQVVAAGITDGKVNYPAGVQKNHLVSVDDLSGLQATDVLVAIDVLERVPDITSFLTQAEKTIQTGGLLFATCPVASGFEIQSLWDKSPSIVPPDKLNLPTVKGLLGLFSASGQWEVLELSTPGMFDVEVVKQTMHAFPNVAWPRSLHALIDSIDRQGVAMFTEYLQSQRLSSFARIVLKKIK